MARTVAAAGRRAPARCWGGRPAPDPALGAAQLPGAGPHALLAGVHPARDPPVLHRERQRGRALRASSARWSTSAPGRSGQAPLRHAGRRACRGPRVDQPLAGADDAGLARLPGADRRPNCLQPHSASVFNISAMSFGALSANAILALNGGARKGGFHARHRRGLDQRLPPQPRRRPGLGDRLGYLAAATPQGRFSEEKFVANATSPQVRLIEIKLSQGAKPGHGGVLPGPKVTLEIAETRAAWRWARTACRRRRIPSSARRSSCCSSCRGCAGLGRQADRLQALHRPSLGMVRDLQGDAGDGLTPDFIVVDGAEGGTGAAPLEFSDHVGAPLQEGLLLVHNTLVGLNLRDRIRLGARARSSARSTSPARWRWARLVQLGARFHVRAGLHPGPALPHRRLPDRRGDPGIRSASRRWWCPTRSSGWRATTATRCTR